MQNVLKPPAIFGKKKDKPQSVQRNKWKYFLENPFEYSFRFEHAFNNILKCRIYSNNHSPNMTRVSTLESIVSEIIFVCLFIQFMFELFKCIKIDMKSKLYYKAINYH